MKKPSKTLVYGIIFLSIIGIGYIFGILCTYWFTKNVHHYEQYRQVIIVFLGGILAGIITVTIFYMGKFHDYQREFIKQEGKLREITNKCKTSFDQSLKVLSYLQSEIQLTDLAKLKEELNPSIEESKKIQKSTLTKFMTAEKIVEKIKEDNNRFSKFPRETIRNIIFDLFPFGIGFVYLSMIIVEPTLGRLFQLVIVLAIGVGSFVRSWYFKESDMSLFHSHYRRISDSIVDIELIKHESDLINSDIVRITKRVYDVDSKNTEQKKHT